jgi:hypothetical protein
MSRWEPDTGAGEWEPRPDVGLGPDVQTLDAALVVLDGHHL